MKQKLLEILNASVLCRTLGAAGKKIGAFLSSSAIFSWFAAERPTGDSRFDRIANGIVESRFGDFIRSGKLIYWLLKIPELPWVFLMLTLVGSMALPTLAVMLLSLMTLALTLAAIFYKKVPLPHFSGGVRVWVLFALMTLVFTLVNYGGVKGILAGGIRFCMLPLLPCTWVLLSESKRVWRTLYVFGAASLAVSLYGMYQYFFTALSAQWTDTDLFSEELGRLTATFENPNVYGTFLLIAVPVTLMAAIFGKGWRAKTFFGLTAALTTLNMFLTYSRGCYVALLVSVLILLFCKGRGWLWAGAGALALSPFYLPESVMQRIMSIGNLADTSVSYRINIWKGALNMFEKYWWMGVGIGDAAFVSIYQSEALTAVEDAPHAHNLFLQIACEGGILGLVILIVFFIWIFRSGISALAGTTGFAKWMRLSLVAVWVGLLVQGMTDYIFYNNNLFAIMMISLGGMIAGRGKTNE